MTFDVQGEFNIYINGKHVKRLKNRIMDAALTAYASCLLGATTDIEIKYLALGTGTTPVTNADVSMSAELFRTADTSLTASAVGVIESSFIVQAAEAVGTIEEIGIFAGSGATGTADTGTLLARALWHHEKTNSEELTITRTDTIRRA